MIFFYSDYLEGAHPLILQRLAECNMLQTCGYGKDDFCKQAREQIRSLCGAPDADVHFLVGGTQTNITVISSILRPYQGVLCAESGHINTHETGALEHSGHKALTLPTRDGKVSAADVDAAMRLHFSEDSPEHEVQPGMLYISFPTELGTIYSKRELTDLKEVCSKWNIPVFIDGARLGYGLASEDCDFTLAELSSLTDVFYIGGTKQGALFGEAVVINNNALKKDFRYCIKQNGGMLAKGRLLGIQFSALLENGLYFELAAKADKAAERIRAAFRKKGAAFLVENRTNQIFPILDRKMIDSLSADFGFEFWKQMEDGRSAVRFCTSWATRDEWVDSLVKAIENA